MFSKQVSITKTTKAMTMEADKTITALFVNSLYDGQVTLCTSSSYDSLQLFMILLNISKRYSFICRLVERPLTHYFT